MEIGSKNAIILCNGEPPKKAQLTHSLQSADIFIAADGGANTAREFGLKPDLIIGDLDSYLQQHHIPCPVIKIPDQSTNDLEKALTYADENGADSVLVFGATGKRVDQTVKNLSVLKQFNNRFSSLVFRDKFCDIKLISSPYTEKLAHGTSVSLFPLSGTVTNITSSGLKYELQNDTLENGVFDGSSNEVSGHQVEIIFTSGDLLLFINHNTE